MDARTPSTRKPVYCDQRPSSLADDDKGRQFSCESASSFDIVANRKTDETKRYAQQILFATVEVYRQGGLINLTRAEAEYGPPGETNITTMMARARLQSLGQDASPSLHSHHAPAHWCRRPTSRCNLRVSLLLYSSPGHAISA